MVLTKDELITALQHEVRVLLHLASKVDAAMLDYRPTAKQRSLLELLQYLVIMGPIHARAVAAGEVDLDVWRQMWRTEEPIAKAMNLEDVKEAIGKQSALFASRGSMIVSLVLSRYAAYRMQLFLYLKACGGQDHVLLERFRHVILLLDGDATGPRRAPSSLKSYGRTAMSEWFCYQMVSSRTSCRRRTSERFCSHPLTTITASVTYLIEATRPGDLIVAEQSFR